MNENIPISPGECADADYPGHTLNTLPPGLSRAHLYGGNEDSSWGDITSSTSEDTSNELPLYETYSEGSDYPVFLTDSESEFL